MLKDFAVTFFILSEDQCALGDWVEINGISGKVEKISLRNTQIRSYNNDLHTFAHSKINHVCNNTHTTSGTYVWIRVPFHTDIEKADQLMVEVIKTMQTDSHWCQYLLDYDYSGIDRIDDFSSSPYGFDHNPGGPMDGRTGISPSNQVTV